MKKICTVLFCMVLLAACEKKENEKIPQKTFDQIFKEKEEAFKEKEKTAREAEFYKLKYYKENFIPKMESYLKANNDLSTARSRKKLDEVLKYHSVQKNLLDSAYLIKAIDDSVYVWYSKKMELKQKTLYSLIRQRFCEFLEDEYDYRDVVFSCLQDDCSTLNVEVNKFNIDMNSLDEFEKYNLFTLAYYQFKKVRYQLKKLDREFVTEIEDYGLMKKKRWEKIVKNRKVSKKQK